MKLLILTPGSSKNKLFLISCAVVGIINIINGLHFLLPQVPYLRVTPYDLGVFFTDKPWDAMGYMPFTLRPFLIGLIFLIPLDISFSCWVFFFLWKAQLVVGSALGYQQRPEFPEQSAGAYIALCVIAVWMARRQILGIFKALVQASSDNTQIITEPLPYKTAVLGSIVGFLLMVFFCCWAGMSFWIA